MHAVPDEQVNEEWNELKRVIKRDSNQKTLTLWDLPMELLNILSRPQTIYKLRLGDLDLTDDFYRQGNYSRGSKR